MRLIRSTLHEVAFAPRSFDLVICVGVLGLWCPVDPVILRRVAGMLNPSGLFFFTAVEDRLLKLTLKRRLASAMRPVLFGRLRRSVDIRLSDFAIVEADVRTLAQPYFQQMDITRWQSPTGRVDLHCVMARPLPS